VKLFLLHATNSIIIRMIRRRQKEEITGTSYQRKHSEHSTEVLQC